MADVEQQQSSLKRWWAHSSALAKLAIFGVLALIALVAIGSLLPDSSSSDPRIKANYAQWLHECQDRATEDVHASDGLYTVGGTHWVGLVNNCLTTKANDLP